MNYYKVSKKLMPKFEAKKIRLGKNYDGGYVVSKKAVLNSKNLISFGVYDDWSFESDFIKNNNKINIFLFDGTINFVFWIKYLVKSLYYFIKKIYSFKKLISNFLQFIKFPFFILKSNVKFYGKNITRNSKKINLKKYSSISQIIEKFYLKNIFFKIDIEKNEYPILNELIKFDDRIECLVIEFHDVNKNLKKILHFIKNFKLKLIHIHINNYGPVNASGLPSVIEFTFVKKDYCKNNYKDLKLPIKNLDFPNNPDSRDKKILFF